MECGHTGSPTSFCGCISGLWSCDGTCPAAKPSSGTPCGDRFMDCGYAGSPPSAEGDRLAHICEAGAVGYRLTKTVSLPLEWSLRCPRSNRFCCPTGELFETEPALRMRLLAAFELAQKVWRNLPAAIGQTRCQAVACETLEAPDVSRHALGRRWLTVPRGRLAQPLQGALVAARIVGSIIFLREPRHDPISRLQPGLDLETDPDHVFLLQRLGGLLR
jgi:hypothetical protein